MRRSRFALPLLIIAALMVSAVPAAARSPIAIGISNPDASRDLASVKAGVYAHKQQMGRFPDVWSIWINWGDRGGSAKCVQDKGNCFFPTASVKWLHSKGITPMIWWQPQDPANWTAGKYERYKRVLAGKHDEYILQFARRLRDASKGQKLKVILRYAHESIGNWFPWSIQNFDNNADNQKRAFRYIFRKFQKVGARKYTRFMWSQVGPAKFAYPGDKWIDYIGVTVLNFGADRYWKNPKSAVDKMARLSRRFTKKPVIFAEVASHYKGGNKAEWIKKAYNRAYNKHPYVKALVYLDTDEPHKATGHPDWRLVKPDDGSAVRAYRYIGNQKRFNGYIR
jgi:hypothetical protein